MVNSMSPCLCSDLQNFSNLFKLRVSLGHDLLQLGEAHRSADSGHDVFTLRVGEVIAVKNLFA